MKGMLNARGQVLRLDLPDQWLGGVEHENQWLLVAQHRLDGLEMQLDLVRPQNKRGEESHGGTRRHQGEKKTTQDDVQVETQTLTRNKISHGKSHYLSTHSQTGRVQSFDCLILVNKQKNIKNQNADAVFILLQL